MSRYDLDELDACWLELVNMELKEMGEYCLFTFFFFFLAWVSHSGPSVCGTKDLEEEMSEMLVLIVSYSRHL